MNKIYNNLNIMREIREGLKAKIDVSIYAKTKYSSEEMSTCTVDKKVDKSRKKWYYMYKLKDRKEVIKWYWISRCNYIQMNIWKNILTNNVITDDIVGIKDLRYGMFCMNKEQ
mgnify:CR=1 FL=1